MSRPSALRWPAAALRKVLGPERLAPLAATTMLSSGADAFVAVSLAGSLFFNVSIEAARPRIIGYLLITTAPFAVVAPLVGPFVDRVRGGHRVVVAAACVGRAALCLLLVRDLRSLLLYPEVFSILVLNKTHSVAKSALVPRLVSNEADLVPANARLSRVSSVAGATGGAIAVGVAAVGSSATVLVVGACAYLAAAVASLRIPKGSAGPRSAVTDLAGEQELRAPSLRLSLSSMALLRAGVGFFAFFAAFSLKALGASTWSFGAVIAAGGIGGFLGTFLAPMLRRLLIEERLLELVLLAPAVVALAWPKEPAWFALLVVAGVLGIAANVGRQAFDSIVQRDAPDAERGRTFARFEARLQLAWVGGALLPVVARPGATTGLALLGAALLIGGVLYGSTSRTAARSGWGRWIATTVPRDYASEDLEVPLPEQLLATARWLRARGAHRQAVVIAAEAVELLGDGRLPGDPGPQALTEELRSRASAGEVTGNEVDRLLDAVARALDTPTDAGGAEVTPARRPRRRGASPGPR